MTCNPEKNNQVFKKSYFDMKRVSTGAPFEQAFLLYNYIIFIKNNAFENFFPQSFLGFPSTRRYRNYCFLRLVVCN